MYEEDSDDVYCEYYNDVDDDNERDTFYALTDGMCGDWWIGPVGIWGVYDFHAYCRGGGIFETVSFGMFPFL